MKKLITFVLCALSLSAFAADKTRHQTMTSKLNEYVGAAGSASPNKALVYFSSRDNVDLIGYQEVSIDDADVSDGILEISRPVSALPAGIYTPAQVAITLTQCQADVGEVVIQANKIVVSTTTLPVRVRCQDSTGNYRQFFQLS